MALVQGVGVRVQNAFWVVFFFWNSCFPKAIENQDQKYIILSFNWINIIPRAQCYRCRLFCQCFEILFPLIFSFWQNFGRYIFSFLVIIKHFVRELVKLPSFAPCNFPYKFLGFFFSVFYSKIQFFIQCLPTCLHICTHGKLLDHGIEFVTTWKNYRVSAVKRAVK